ncbi:hypothetical protein PTTG_26036 [Puccinia triticina 1-1 BBBD Race 1]|uniref:Uncharacterized protein n=1 Tax=Puccinia triticina (isolate 1-1 / race 1 (BBBD)) TaxID=630390 RepID=A0A180GXA5_PUCT1|nr:hypothetical protein PTTG_26036 [Puccinia triticina 1-1 BBBD Race 1]
MGRPTPQPGGSEPNHPDLRDSATGWEIPTLISQSRQGLNKDIQMVLIISRTSFTTINKFSSLALELNTAMGGAEAGNAVKIKV